MVTWKWLIVEDEDGDYIDDDDDDAYDDDDDDH